MVDNMGYYDLENAPIEEAIHIPMVSCMIEGGIYPDNAQAIFNMTLMENPYMVIHNIPISEGETDPLMEAFLTAYMLTNGNKELLAEAAQYDNYEIATEAILQKIADSTPGRLIRKGANEIKHTINPIGQSLMNAVHNLQKENEEMNREMVVSGSILLKIRHIFKKILLYWVAKPFIFALVPGGALGLLVALVYTVKKYLDIGRDVWDTAFHGNHANLAPDTKNRVIQELELELKMVREKIEDAKSAGDKQTKYQLMRLENKIEMELTRVKYGQEI